MNTSSTRLRLSAALAATTLGLFALGGSAFAGENGQGAERRNDRAGAQTETQSDGGSHSDGETQSGTESEKSSPSEAKAAQFETDEAAYDGESSRHPSGNDRTEEAGGSGTQGQSTSDPDGMTNGGVDKSGGQGGINLEDQDANNGCGNDQDFEDDNNGWCGKKPKPAETTTPAPPVVGGEQQVKCPEGSTMPVGGTTTEDCVKDVTCPEGSTMSAGGTTTDDCVEDGKTIKETKEEVVTPDVLGGTLTGGTVAPEAVLGTQLQNLPEGVETRVLGVSIERAAPADTATTGGTGTGTSVLGASFARGGVLARTGFGLTLVGLVGLALVLVGVALQRAGRNEHGPLA